MSNARSRLAKLAGSYLSTTAEIAASTRSYDYTAIAYSMVVATWTWVTQQ
jgi:hypothetical protein